MANDPIVRWTPDTEADRESIRLELNLMLASHHFRHSRRYPSLLQYLVDTTLRGSTKDIKERTLGVEVFGRSPDYDTNLDPVVRVTAGEVRRRIAQFYREGRTESEVQIELPLGSYVPEFRRNLRGLEAMLPIDIQGPMLSGTKLAPAFSQETAVLTDASPVTRARFWSKSFTLRNRLIALGLVACLGILAFRHQNAQSVSDKFWGPLLASSGPVLTVLPSSLSPDVLPDSPLGVVPATLTRGGPYSRVSICDAIALSRLANVLGSRAKPFNVREAKATSLSDLHERPAILIGAMNNIWTMRLTEHLRYHFVAEPSSVRIADSQDASNVSWSVDYTKPYAYAQHDYAIVARYHDRTTGGEVMVIAGIGAHATQAAGVFVANAADLEQIARLAPRGWENKDLEMIVETDIVNGDGGPPKLVAVSTW